MTGEGREMVKKKRREGKEKGGKGGRERKGDEAPN